MVLLVLHDGLMVTLIHDRAYIILAGRLTRECEHLPELEHDEYSTLRTETQAALNSCNIC